MKKLTSYTYFWMVIFQITLYVVAYLIKTFVLFEFTNPFEWIMMIPNLTQEERGCILILYVLLLPALYHSTKEILNEKSSNNEKIQKIEEEILVSM